MASSAVTRALILLAVILLPALAFLFSAYPYAWTLLAWALACLWLMRNSRSLRAKALWLNIAVLTGALLGVELFSISN